MADYEICPSCGAYLTRTAPEPIPPELLRQRSREELAAMVASTAPCPGSFEGMFPDDEERVELFGPLASRDNMAHCRECVDEGNKWSRRLSPEMTRWVDPEEQADWPQCSQRGARDGRGIRFGQLLVDYLDDDIHLVFSRIYFRQVDGHDGLLFRFDTKDPVSGLWLCACPEYTADLLVINQAHLALNQRP